MPTYEVVARVTLHIEAENADDALVLAKQSVQAAMWVEDYHWVRLQEVACEDQADGTDAPFGLRSDWVRGR